MTSRNSLQSASYLPPSSPFQAQVQSTSTSSLVTPTLSLLADPPPRFLDAAAYDYLVIEMVGALRGGAKRAEEKRRAVEKEMIEAGLLPASSSSLEKQGKKEKDRESTGSGGSGVRSSGLGVTKVDDPEEEGLRVRLEAIGIHVGSNIAERLCKDRGARFTDTLDAVKFVCKDVWALCWDKQVDNLRTNHRGVYVLQDNAFKPILRISSFEGHADAVRRAKLFVAMPAGIIRGALARIGYHGVVVPEITTLPQCTFQVKLPKGS
ncbi:transport protein particle component [Rickenella mellea]|uniref:Transport protein particle component n=1 Tax=Rickenella mellea TaxID=50990 RepID=A0A4Y7Q6C1_9AGAM|nr:transport protein particle component [Rickenella mellea]